VFTFRLAANLDTDLYHNDMANSMILSDRSSWLLVIIDSVQYVNGNTRLQKYVLLASKIPLKEESAYVDWESSHFGAFSPQLVADMDYLTSNNFIESHTVQSPFREEYNRYSLSAKGKEALSEFKSKHADLTEKIKTITGYYFSKPLNELLADAYALFPEYTSKSKIKPLVRKTLLERDSDLSTQFELPYTDKKVDLSSITSTAEINPFMYNDEDFRQKLAEQAGLSKIPPLDASAYDELSEIFADKKFLVNVDPEKLMKEVRT